MALTAAVKAQLLTQYQRKPNDTGSPEVQIALLSTDIEQLARHFQLHHHDNHSKRGLLAKVSRRHKLLRYLKRTNKPCYQQIITRFKLRDKA